MLLTYFRREVFSQRRFFAFFILLFLVVFTALGLLENLRSALQEKMTQDGEKILTSHLSIGGRRLLTDLEREAMNTVMASHWTKQTHLITSYSMVKGPAHSGLVNLKGIDENYPLIGEISLQMQKVLSPSEKRSQLERSIIWVTSQAREALKLGIGDDVKIGDSVFKVQDLVEADSTASLLTLQLAPTIYIGREHLFRIGLIRQGSTLTSDHHFLLKDTLSESQIRSELERQLADPGIKVKGPKNASEQLGKIFQYSSDQMILLLLAAVFLACLGATYLLHGFFQRKYHDIAVLRSLGLSSKKLLGAYFLLFYLVALILFLACLGLIWLGTSYLQTASFLPSEIRDYIHFSKDVVPLLLILSFFMLAFVVAPVLSRLTQLKVQELFQETPRWSLSFKVRDIIVYIPAAIFFWATAIMVSHSLKIGTIFFVSFLIPFLLIFFGGGFLLGFLGEKFIEKVDPQMTLRGLRLALRPFIRSKRSTLTSVLSLGLGIMLLLSVAQIDHLMRSQLHLDDEARPSLFLMDIQDEQVPTLKNLFDNQGFDGKLSYVSPWIRARLLKINGRDFQRETKDKPFFREEEMSRGLKNRTVNLSYRENLLPSERIVKGKFFEGSYNETLGALPEVSIDQKYAKNLGISLGDRLLFDISGLEIEGKVTSFRMIRWTSFLPNFFIIFQPGMLDLAPKTWISVVENVSPSNLVLVRERVVELLPNVSLINVDEVMGRVQGIMKILYGILGGLSLFTLFIGLFVLWIIKSEKEANLKEDFYLYRLLGLKDWELKLLSHYEFLLVGFVSVILGSLFSFAFTYVISMAFFDNQWTPNFWPPLLAFGVLFLWYFKGKLFESFTQGR